MTELVVHKEITVERSQEDAFRIYTEELGSWWPLATHAVHNEATDAVFEMKLGGRLYERTADGLEADWGYVLAWDPPHGFTISWKPTLDPDAPFTTYEVRFVSAGDQRTRLELVHTGWEAFGDAGADTRDGYDSGWDVVLAAFTTGTVRR
jgi:hypothetical protein